MSARPPIADPLRKAPSQTRALRTVETLLEAARRLLAADGEAGFTTNRIAERAGYSIGTLYQYFPSKEAIIVALVRRQRERVMRELDQLLDEALAQGRPADEVLPAYIRRLIDAFGRGQQAAALLARLGWQLDAPDLVVAAMDASTLRIADALARLDHPDWPVPDTVTLYALSRAVMGALRAATSESHPALDDPRFEAALVRIATSLLHAPRTP